MKFVLPFASLAAVLALSACAVPETQPEPKQASAAASGGPQSDVVCFFEAPTGTNRKVRRCMSKEEYNKGLEAGQRMAGEMRAPPPPPQN